MFRCPTNQFQNLGNDHLSKFDEPKEMKNQQIVCGKLMPQFSDKVFISWFFHGLKSLIFHG